MIDNSLVVCSSSSFLLLRLLITMIMIIIETVKSNAAKTPIIIVFVGEDLFDARPAFGFI